MDNLLLAYVLIAVGLILLVAELFIPSGGILFVLAVVAIIVGVAMTFASGGTSTGMVTLLAVFIAVPVLTGIAFHLWPRTRFGQRMMLTGPEEDETVATMPVILELEQLRGRYGRTVSALRPSGLTDFDGKRIDTLSEGTLIEPGQWVRCIDVKAGKVIVRQVDAPPDLGDIDTSSFT